MVDATNQLAFGVRRYMINRLVLNTIYCGVVDKLQNWNLCKTGRCACSLKL